ncbi:unnamed protein product, partial [Polarella glacialis]
LSSGQSCAISESPAQGIGFQVWRAAGALCHHLALEASDLTGRKVLELGAGCGLVGICCGHLGADVTLTDQASVLPILRHNVQQNELPAESPGSLRVHALHWGCDVSQELPLPREGFDLIVGSDLTYFEHLHEALLLTLLQLVRSPGTEVLLAHTRRREEFERWLDRFEVFFETRLLREIPALQTVPLGSADEGAACKGGPAADDSATIAIYSLRLRGTELLSEQELDQMLMERNDQSQLLARLAMLESDIATIEAEEEEEGELDSASK